MDWGSRRIRSAGRTSGSVEITLPAEMQALEGVEGRSNLSPRIESN